MPAVGIIAAAASLYLIFRPVVRPDVDMTDAPKVKEVSSDSSN